MKIIDVALKKLVIQAESTINLNEKVHMQEFFVSCNLRLPEMSDLMGFYLKIQN